MTMADRIVVMHQGRIQQVGRPLEIYGDPANRFVAGFFGGPAMNFVEGELRPETNGARFVAQAPGATLPRHSIVAGPARLGIRPEHVRLADGRESWPATGRPLGPPGDRAPL